MSTTPNPPTPAALDNRSGDQAHRDAEETLRNEMLFSDTMIASMPGILYFYDGEGRFLRWNKNFEAVSGYSREEISRMHPLDFFKGEDKARVEQRIGEVFVKGESSIEASFVAKDGTATLYFFTGRSILFDGKKCLVGVGIDVSDRRRAEDRLAESEARYRKLFECAPDGMVIADSESYYLDANPSACRMLGYTRDELIGLHASDIVVPGEVENIAPALNAIKETSDHHREWQFRRKDGSIFSAEVIATMMPDGNLLGMIRDVTERRRLEDQLRQAQKMEAVGRLAGGVAHDFNNLLTIISGYSHLLLGLPEVNPSVRKKLEAIGDASTRAASLTRQLLGFSRQTVLQPKVLDLNTVVTETGKMLRRLIGEDIKFTTVIAPNISRVKVDPGQLDQVLMNLAVNARDAMPKGGKLTIETADVLLSDEYAASHLDCKAGPHVMLAVTDTGCGMTPDVMARIFEPFFTTKEVGKGTGLGLAMVFGIVRLSGGSIHVYSEPGHGTTFKIYFPAVIDQAAKPSDAVSNLDLKGTETILLVEDEEAVRALTLMTLQKQGYQVLTATDGMDALTILQSHRGPLDLVLTDVVMPNVCGPDLAEALKARFPQTKVLFMSGYTDDAVFRHGLLEAKVSFIQKPYTPQGLAKKVREILDKDKDPG